MSAPRFGAKKRVKKSEVRGCSPSPTVATRRPRSLAEMAKVDPIRAHPFVPMDLDIRGAVPPDSPMAPCGQCGTWKRNHASAS